jgi:hypothetical protein
MAGGLPFPVALIAQAGMLGYSAARNGPNVLIGFTAGLMGGITGGLAAKMVGDSLNRAIDSSIAQAADYQSNIRDMDQAGRGLGTGTLREGPELRSAEAVKAESDFNAMGMHDYGGGVWNAWNAGDPIYAWLGQAVSIQAENVNILPTALTVTANGMSQGLWIGPLEVHEFNFYTFTSEPYPWRISASTSGWGVIYYKIQSTWVPGMPPNP